jgi:ATP-binding cassette subfamily B protein
MYFMRQTIIVMSRWIEFDLKNELYDKYQALSLSFYRKNNTGDLMARISEDVAKVRMYIGPAVMYGINLIALFVFVITVMIRVNPELTFYVLLPLPVLAWGIYYVNNLILNRSTAIQQQLGKLTSFSQEAYSGIRVIKSYGREDAFAKLFSIELNDLKNKALQLVKVDALYFPLTMLLIGLSTIITVYMGGMQVAAGAITAGNIAEFVIYVNMLTWPVTSVGWVASIMQQAAASQQRIDAVLHEKTEIDSNAGKTIQLKGAIRWENVGFTYKQTGIRALENISFSIEPGQTLGIIGRTGSGKSTLANLMSRLYDPTEGKIMIDGQDITSLHPGDLRRQMGYVPQEVFLFSDTIANNISFGLDNFNEEAIENAARQAALTPTLAALPEGYNTLLGERGVTLSGGQKQRLAIARALIRQPKLYVIDDCLSALDTQTEKEILGNIHQLTKDTTTIIISHRISSVMHANQILVLDHGRLVASGTHETLMQEGGFYYDIYQKQQQAEKEGQLLSND